MEVRVPSAPCFISEATRVPIGSTDAASTDPCGSASRCCAKLWPAASCSRRLVERSARLASRGLRCQKCCVARVHSYLASVTRMVGVHVTHRRPGESFSMVVPVCCAELRSVELSGDHKSRAGELPRAINALPQHTTLCHDWQRRLFHTVGPRDDQLSGTRTEAAVLSRLVLPTPGACLLQALCRVRKSPGHGQIGEQARRVGNRWCLNPKDSVPQTEAFQTGFGNSSGISRAVHECPAASRRSGCWPAVRCRGCALQARS